MLLKLNWLKELKHLEELSLDKQQQLLMMVEINTEMSIMYKSDVRDWAAEQEEAQGAQGSESWGAPPAVDGGAPW